MDARYSAMFPPGARAPRTSQRVDELRHQKAPGRCGFVTKETVRSDRERFVINLDVKHFSPEDLTVKIMDDFVEIHGKHNERQDDHGFISREFHRRYRLPQNVDHSSVSCSLSGDGILTFSGPKLLSNLDSSHSERPIPVSRDEKPTSAPSS
ncbi:alpha-crystallin A chain isoform X2 [Hyla sarda]|uniref:alpha-crystallin A chain isoform X2 n=1 Tax=Hyla sarda TaxID=327740 RepID=UPI0024C41B4C|nr:alpha-crystallin A chain isoform X2 [Hyla sarda]